MKSDDQKEKILEEYYKYIGIVHAENTAKEADEIMEKSKDIDFPEELDLWFKDYISHATKEDKKKKSNNRVSSFAKRAAIFFIILGLGGFLTTMSVEAYRIRFLNLVTEVTERYTSISIEREPEDTNKNNTLGRSHFYPEDIPAGYKESDAQSYGPLRLIYFDNEKGDRIEFLQTESDPDFQVDTEDAIIEDIRINGSKGILVSKDELKTLLWFTDNNNFYIMGKLDQEKIVSMAESLELVK